MIHERGERLLNSVERHFGKLAFPQIVRWIAGFQVLTYLLSLFSPDLLEWIDFDRGAIFSGQVWRAFTWVLYPRSSMVLFVLIMALFLFFLNDSLEGEWGSFRLTVYVVATVVLLSLTGLLPVSGLGGLLNAVFFSSILLAFASLFPNHVIHLMLIIPIKAKWLGWFNAALLAGAILLSNAPVVTAVVVVAGLLPWGLVFLPHFAAEYKRSGEARVRRHKFESQRPSEDDAFHTCDNCGATDQSHPDREFRVTADGRELCSVCRAKSKDTGTVAG